MELIQSTKPSEAATFGAIVLNYFEIVTSPLIERDYHRVDIVFDPYWPVSIKSAAQKKRGEGNALEITINGPSTPVPKPWKKYNSKSRNKTNLLSPPLSWRKTAMEQLPQGKNLVIGGGLRNGKLAVSTDAKGKRRIRETIKRRPQGSRHKAPITCQTCYEGCGGSCHSITRQ